MSFHSNTACGDKVNAELASAAEKGAVQNEFSCNINMQTLAAPPYNLKMGDSIYYRIRAQNLVGWGEWNQPQPNGERVVAKPPHPVAPKIDQLGKDGFRVCWSPPAGLLSLARIRHDYKFYLHHNEGKDIQIMEYTQVKGPTSDLCHIFTGLNRKLLHKVLIYIENECGKCPSPVTPVPIGTVPAAPACRVTDKACVVYITWNVPKSRAPITGYNI